MLNKIWTRRRGKRSAAAESPVAWTLSGRALHGQLLRQATLPVITVGVLLLVAGVFGAWRVHRLYKRGSDILSENVASIRAAEELETLMLESRYRLKRYLNTGNERHLEEIAVLLPTAQKWRNRAEQLAKTPSEQQLIRQLNTGFEQLAVRLESLDSPGGLALDQADQETSRHRDFVQLADTVIPDQILEKTHQYIVLNERELANSNAQNQSSANQLMLGLVILGTCGGVAGLLLGYVIARRVSHTIVQLSLPIRDTAGKLDQVVGPVAVSADPDFDDLESMLQTVSSSVTTVVERLQANEREILRAEQLAAMGQLAAGLAHELRNPLTSLKAIVQLADTPAELTDRDLDVLKQEICRLEVSVQTFLDFARPPQPEKRTVELRSLVIEAVELVARQAQRKSIRLEYEDIDDRYPVMVDAAQIRQVILNLLLNALDAVSIGGVVRVILDVEYDAPVPGDRHNDAPVGWRVLRLADDGPGLPAEIEDRIFAPFTSTKESGLGLGLSICKRILEAHGGTITATNGEPTGAVFATRLPLMEYELPPAETLHAEIANR